jgi:hypothetical protein
MMLGTDEVVVADLELGINRPKIRCRPHENLVRAEGEESSSALGVVGHDDRHRLAPRLGSADKPNRDFAVAAGGYKKEMEILAGRCVEEQFLEVLDTVGEDCVDHDHQAAVVSCLVVPNELLTLVSRSLLSEEERRSPAAQRARWCLLLNRIRLPLRSFRPNARASCAFSARSVHPSGGRPSGVGRGGSFSCRTGSGSGNALVVIPMLSLRLIHTRTPNI